MAIFNNWQSAPKKVISGRCVNYKAEPTNWNGNGVADPVIIYWTVTRTCGMRYQYVGMTKAAADQCVSDLRRLYTRKYMRWTVDLKEADKDDVAPFPYVNQLETFECSSDIQSENVAGDNWCVNVSVDETDVIISRNELVDYDAIVQLFQLADARDLKTDNPTYATISITSAKWDSIAKNVRGTFDVWAIQNWDPTAAVIEVDQAGSWVQVQGSATVSGGSGELYIANVTDNVRFRIRYGQTSSEPWKTADMKIAAMSIVKATRIDSYETDPRGFVSQGSFYVDVYIHTEDINNSFIDMLSAWKLTVGFVSNDYNGIYVDRIEKIDSSTFRIRSNYASFTTAVYLGYSDFVRVNVLGQFVGQAALQRSDFISMPITTTVENSVQTGSSPKRLVTLRAQFDSDLTVQQLMAGDFKLVPSLEGESYGIQKVGSVTVVQIRATSSGLRTNTAGQYAMTATFAFDATYGDTIPVSAVVTAKNANNEDVSSPTFALSLTAEDGVRLYSVAGPSGGRVGMIFSYAYLDGWTPTLDPSKVRAYNWAPSAAGRDTFEQAWKELTVMTVYDGSFSVAYNMTSNDPGVFRMSYDNRPSNFVRYNGSSKNAKLVMLVSSRMDFDGNMNVIFKAEGLSSSFSTANLHVFAMTAGGTSVEITGASLFKYDDMFVYVSPAANYEKVYATYVDGDDTITSNCVLIGG